jgi:peptidoglycan/xylan/chitin deacetylase (PgdA/CDA1 family)
MWPLRTRRELVHYYRGVIARDSPRADVLVLCYHAISPSWDAVLSLTPSALESQLRSLLRSGWRGTTFTEAVLEPRWRRTLAVTFDDAFLSVLERAYPILSSFGLPATVFVPTKFAPQRQPLLWPGVEHWSRTAHASELQSMDWSDLAQLASNGWEIGSHTDTHPRLTELDDTALEAELARSRAACQEHLGECKSLAYPYGAVDDRVAQKAAEAGYSCAAALAGGLAPLGPFRHPRVGIYHGDSRRRFALKVGRLSRRIRASRLWSARP